ncbi:hypothetical protein ACFXOM_06485 [Streptomyces sp. NPDC059169]|uniref:hypothetical protein n=1 Tax=unclassified Streptomyces TaxID=2593676 RepID=UPI0036A8E916
MYIFVNGAAVAANTKAALAAFGTQAVTTVVNLNEGDVISLAVFQDTGNEALTQAATASNGQPLNPVLQAELLAPADSGKKTG